MSSEEGGEWRKWGVGRFGKEGYDTNWYIRRLATVHSPNAATVAYKVHTIHEIFQMTVAYMVHENYSSNGRLYGT